MSRFEGPQGIVTNGLVLNLDAGDPDSYTRSQPPYVEVLVVAGGGAGGNGNGGGYEAGGGGAGGVLYNSAYQLTNAAAITVTVGAGGGSKTGAGSGNNGSNSVFGSLTAIGGGGGSTGTAGNTGNSGGSGGGGAHPKTPGGAGTPGQGYEGFTPDVNSRGGGGGGAGGPGSFGVGGNGVAYSISGTSTYYGGGGGGVLYSPNNGGLVGGGNGSTSFRGTNTDTGDPNTGGGGGGGYSDTDTIASGGAGGSGIVILRYPGLPAATGGTITYLNGYTIHTFTSSGTFTPYLWNDVSGNGNNFDLYNGTGYSSKGYVIFDGTDDYSRNTSTLSNFPTGSHTIEILHYNNGAPSSYPTLFNRGGQSTATGFWWCYRTGTNGTEFNWQYSYVSGYTVQSKSSFWDYQAWVHAVITVDYSNFVLTVYKNGSNVYAPSLQNTIRTVTAGDMYIGAYQANTNSYREQGNMSVFRVYNRVLSATEVLQNYNAVRARFGI